MSFSFKNSVRNLPIKKKIALLTMGISGFILFFTSVIQMAYGTYFGINSVRDELNIIAQVIGHQSLASLEFLDQQEATRNLSSLNIREEILAACLYDENESLFATYHNKKIDLSALGQQCPEKSILVNSVNSHRITTFYEIKRDNQKIGSIIIQGSVSHILSIMLVFGAAIAILFVFAMLLAYILSSHFQAIISTPILHLATVTKQLTKDSDYSIRASRYGNDELGTLVDAFNTMITNIQTRDIQLNNINEKLEVIVNERTKELQVTNNNLLKSIKKTHQAQDQLIQSEKMASLAGLVAGVAHEINTPVGVGVTAISHLSETVNNFKDRYNKGDLTKTELESFMDTASEATHLVLANLKRSADLIRSFKQIAVDQSSEEMRIIRLKQYIEETLISLKPKLNGTTHSIVQNCTCEQEIYCYPGALSQIITNLVMNSIIHGFEGRKNGKIILDVTVQNGHIFFNYSDNGNGISKENINKIFEPFYTTKRGQGGSGLGMSIVYNLVTQKLGGTIECCSEPNVSTTFMMHIPPIDLA